MKFTKMHGLGNDFIIFDERQKISDVDFKALTPQICDRNMGVGADGVIRVLPSKNADYRMEIINSDGSIPEMCGNGIRCFAKYVFEHSPEHKEVFSVETPAGLIIPAIEIQNKKVVAVEVDMGEPILEPVKIPVKNFEKGPVLNQALEAAGQKFVFSAISMGNPHVVIETDKLSEIKVSEIGPQIEHHAWFPARTNVHFITVNSRTEITVRHWERGAGETLACGTGACACVVAMVLNGKVDRKVNVKVPGGVLKIVWDADTNHVLMTGPAAKVYEGDINL